MTKSFKAIYLSWRRGRSARRHIIGKIIKEEGKVKFAYVPEGVSSAQSEGFISYTEFPDTGKQYEEGVLDIISQRLTPSNRASTSVTSNFWSVPNDERNDKLVVLAYTQGLLPTDTYEFLADFEPKPGLKFVTDLAGLSYINVPVNLLSDGDNLQWKIEEDNPIDPSAIMVFKSDVHVGYIKKVHTSVFKEYTQGQIQLTVQAIEKNGIVKNIFVRIDLL